MTDFGALHHVVLRVPDLPAAESYYRDLLGLDVLFREGSLDDEYGTLPDGLDWPDAVAAGVDPGMTFLNRDALSIALVVAETIGEGRLDHIALSAPSADRDDVRERADDLDCEYEAKEGALFLTDRYGIEWELNGSAPPPETPFETLDV